MSKAKLTKEQIDERLEWDRKCLEDSFWHDCINEAIKEKDEDKTQRYRKNLEEEENRLAFRESILSGEPFDMQVFQPIKFYHETLIARGEKEVAHATNEITKNNRLHEYYNTLQKYSTYFQDALYANNQNVIKAFISKGVTPAFFCWDDYGRAYGDAPVLTAMARYASLETLELMKEALKDKGGLGLENLPKQSVHMADQPKSPLLAAAKRGDVAVMQFLLENGLDLATQDKERAFLEAIKHNHCDMVAYLIDKGAQVQNAAEYFYTQAPMQIAAQHALPEMLGLLMEHGAGIELETFDPALVSNGFEHYDAEQLEEKFAQENPLHLAIREGKVENMKFLVQHGATLTENDLSKAAAFLVSSIRYSSSPEDQARKENNTLKSAETSKRMLSYLLDNIPTATGEDAFVEAVNKGDIALVELILEKRPTLSGKAGARALAAAVRHNNIPMLQRILTQWPDVDAAEALKNAASNAELRNLLLTLHPEANTDKALIQFVKDRHRELEEVPKNIASWNGIVRYFEAEGKTEKAKEYDQKVEALKERQTHGIWEESTAVLRQLAPNATQEGKDTALYAMLVGYRGAGCVKLAKLLLEHAGADPNGIVTTGCAGHITNSIAGYVLEESIHQEQKLTIQKLELLMEYGADFSKVQDSLDGALYDALQFQSLELATFLLHQGANPSAQQNNQSLIGKLIGDNRIHDIHKPHALALLCDYGAVLSQEDVTAVNTLLTAQNLPAFSFIPGQEEGTFIKEDALFTEQERQEIMHTQALNRLLPERVGAFAKAKQGDDGIIFGNVMPFLSVNDMRSFSEVERSKHALVSGEGFTGAITPKAPQLPFTKEAYNTVIRARSITFQEEEAKRRAARGEEIAVNGQNA